MGFQFKSSSIHSVKTLFREPNALKSLVVKATKDVPIPSAVIRRFSQFKLLEGIPFHYLVPHPGMLPEESIKFFYLDPNWVNALIDGAYSIGRYSAKKKDPHGQTSLGLCYYEGKCGVKTDVNKLEKILVIQNFWASLFI